ncbi:MAG: DUF2380 domain-containing protein, partial [Gammaproteobacteria bacterium]|nr:DUF2380 domain-containing protein [Gammaproteobacteria bacterium]
LRGCNGCERRLGRAADADLVLVGWVQKVSELILNINAVVREVESGRRVAGGSVSL